MENFKPRNCTECPLVIQACEEVALMLSDNKRIAANVMGSGFDMAMSMVYENMPTQSGIIGIEGQEIESAEDFASYMRKGIAAKMDEVDSEAEETRCALDTLVENCEGPLKMRARKAGRVVTVTVCNSEVADPGFSRETVHVDRRPE